MLGAFEDIVRRGRARGIGVTLITQRAAVINKNVLTQIEVLVCLRTIAPQDREAIDGWIEVHGTQKQRDEMMANIASLPIGTAYFWSPGWLDIFKKVEVRKRTTFDSSSTPKVGEKVVGPKEVAAVDLESLGAQIKGTVERAKANDPAELKRALATAQREVKRLESSKPVADKVTSAPTKTVPALTDAERKRLTKLIAGFERVEAILKKESVEKILRDLYPDFLSIKATLAAKIEPAKPLPPIRSHDFQSARSNVPMRTVGSADTSIGEPGKGARAILIAAAQHPDGVTDEQIAVLTGYKKTSRTTYKQQLKAAGYLSEGGRGYLATDTGMTWLGADYAPLPTGDALRDHWMRTLPQGELNLFKVYVENHPDEVPLDAMMQATGYQKTSVTTYRQKLSARNLITGHRASDNLFD